MKLLGVYFIAKDGYIRSFKRLPRKIKKQNKHFIGDITISISIPKVEPIND